MCGVSLARANVRQEFNINIIAIGRGDTNLFNPNPDELMASGDILFILGKDSDIQAFTKYAEN